MINALTLCWMDPINTMFVRLVGARKLGDISQNTALSLDNILVHDQTRDIAYCIMSGFLVYGCG